MLPGEKDAILEIYDVVRIVPGTLFSGVTHQTIARARQEMDTVISAKIHELRIYAEKNIHKPVMKKYKAMLREGLFG